MFFEFVPIAEASVATLMNKIDKVIINPIIYFMFACAMAYFLYGIVEYFLNPDSEEIRKSSKSHMLWGVVGMFIMVASLGIIRLILNTVGEKNISVQGTGQIQIDRNQTFTNELADRPIEQDKGGGVVVPGNSSPTPTPGIQKDPFSVSPFDTQYTSTSECWKKAIVSKSTTDYGARNAVKGIARAEFLTATKQLDNKVDPSMPAYIESIMRFDLVNKIYYYWVGAVAPLYPGADCGINQSSNSTTLPDPTKGSNQNAGTNPTNGADTPSPLTLPSAGQRSDLESKNDPVASPAIAKMRADYKTDASSWRVVDSGVSTNTQTAKNIAIQNARIEIAKLNGSTDLSKINYTILKEHGYKIENNIHYWIAIASPK